MAILRRRSIVYDGYECVFSSCGFSSRTRMISVCFALLRRPSLRLPGFHCRFFVFITDSFKYRRLGPYQWNDLSRVVAEPFHLCRFFFRFTHTYIQKNCVPPKNRENESEALVLAVFFMSRAFYTRWLYEIVPDLYIPFPFYVSGASHDSFIFCVSFSSVCVKRRVQT